MSYFIDSLSNPKIKRLKKLLDSSKFRRDQTATILDGDHLIQSFFASNRVPEAIFIKRSEFDQRKAWFNQFNKNLDDIIYNISDDVYYQLSTIEESTGLLAIINYSILFNQIDTSSMIILDAIQDPGNLGSIIRTCGAFGIKTLLLSKGCVDAWSPKVLRSAMGGHFCLNIVDRLTYDEIAHMIKQNPKNYTLGTALMPSAESLFEFQFDELKSYIWCFGNEGSGLSQELLDIINQPIYIPMCNTPIIESLNVASSVAICLSIMKKQSFIK